MTDLERCGRWGDARRLRELRNLSVSHDWLWALNSCHGPVVPRNEFLTAVRVRLGAPSVDADMTCPRCERAILDKGCMHALVCAGPEATRGYYAVRDAVLQLAHLADPSAEAETPELIPSAPTLRPPDIFTSAAVSGCWAALDIGVTSPEASGAGEDCCERCGATRCRSTNSMPTN